jgi:outer membrane biosynthesis protein TonB
LSQSGIGFGGARDGVVRDDGSAAWPATFQTFISTPPGTYEFRIADPNGVWPNNFVLTVTPPPTTTTVAGTEEPPAEPEPPEEPEAAPTQPAPPPPAQQDPEPTDPPTTVAERTLPPPTTTTTTTTTTTVPPTTTTVTLVPPGFEARGPGGSSAGEPLPWMVAGVLALMVVAAAAAVVTAYSGFELRMAVARWRLNRAEARRLRIGPVKSVAAWWRAGVRGRRES